MDHSEQQHSTPCTYPHGLGEFLFGAARPYHHGCTTGFRALTQWQQVCLLELGITPQLQGWAQPLSSCKHKITACQRRCPVFLSNMNPSRQIRPLQGPSTTTGSPWISGSLLSDIWWPIRAKNGCHTIGKGRFRDFQWDTWNLFLAPADPQILDCRGTSTRQLAASLPVGTDSLMLAGLEAVHYNYPGGGCSSGRDSGKPP